MNADTNGGGGILKHTASEFSEDECTSMAAALAFYTALSMPPLLVIIVTVAGWIWGPEQVTGQIEQQVTSVVGQGGWEQVRTMMENAGRERSQGIIATIVSVVLLIFSATGVMVQLQAALNRAWQVEPDPQRSGVTTFITKRIMSLAMVLGIAFLLIVSMTLTAVLKAASGEIMALLPAGTAAWTPQAVNVAVNLIIFTLLFAAMFKWLPDAVIRWRDTWFGAAITALLFIAGQFGMGIYFGMKQTGTYGMASSFVLLLIWVYYSSMILLFGAEFTQVWAQRHGRTITPEEGAVRVVERKKRVDDSAGTETRRHDQPSTTAPGNTSRRHHGTTHAGRPAK